MEATNCIELGCSAQKTKLSIKDLFIKCDQMWSHLLIKSLWKISFFVQC